MKKFWKRKPPVDLRPTDPYIVFRPGSRMMNVSIRTVGNHVEVELLEDGDVTGIETFDATFRLTGPRAMLTYGKAHLNVPLLDDEAFFTFPTRGPNLLGSTNILGVPPRVAFIGGDHSGDPLHDLLTSPCSG